jgi:hypothetical protein
VPRLIDITENALQAGTILCILANAFEVAAKAAKAQFVMRNSAEVNVPPHWIPYLATVEAAGVIGLTAGLLGPRLIGLAAAIGLIAFFVGATTAHIRARAFHNIAFPATFLLLAVTATLHFA